MKKPFKIIITGILAFAMIFPFMSCGENDVNTKNVRIITLNGTTGFGMAKMMSDENEDYSISVQADGDAEAISKMLIRGDVDIAALPTNAAANLYAKTEGGIKILAVNTLGVLYVVTNEENSGISSLSDLEGKNIYCPAQNPTFIFKGLCEKAGVNVTVDNTYAKPADLRTAVASGKVGIAVLPEPMVTIAKSKNPSLSVSIDLTSEWNKHFPENSLMQGCVVARTEFIRENPDEVKKFLRDYKLSVDFVNNEPEEAAKLIASTSIFENAAVAQKAIPRCNIKYVDGQVMADALNVFYGSLYSINPQAVGGSVPDNGIYYISND